MEFRAYLTMIYCSSVATTGCNCAP